jgi:hypothetical protein
MGENDWTEKKNFFGGCQSVSYRERPQTSEIDVGRKAARRIYDQLQTEIRCPAQGEFATHCVLTAPHRTEGRRVDHCLHKGQQTIAVVCVN